MKITVSSVLDYDRNTVFRLLMEPKTLLFVSEPVIRFSNTHELPAVWETGVTYTLFPSILGTLRQPPQEVVFVECDAERGIIRTQERSTDIDRWNHTMSVSSINDTTTLYTDEINLKAGAITHLFVHFLYRSRHRRWQKISEIV